VAKSTFILPKLMPRDRAICRIVDALEDLPISEGFRVEIHEHKATRSDKQNATLWWIYEQIIKIGGETLGGWTKEDVHEYCLGEKFGWERHKAFGRTKLKPVRRSSRLSKTEFAEFVEWIYAHFEDKGFVLARPDPDHEMHEAQAEKAA
jgi:hypothetical protein